jgi:hypothetical protein
MLWAEVTTWSPRSAEPSAPDEITRSRTSGRGSTYEIA